MNLSGILNFQSMYVMGLENVRMNELITSSLEHVIKDFFMLAAASFVITVSCSKVHAELYYRAIMQNLYQTEGMVVQLVYVDKNKPQRVPGTRLHNLILVDSLDGFLTADIAYYTRRKDSTEYYHIFLQEYDALLPNALQQIFEYCWRHMLINCNVETQSKQGQLRIYTYFPYTDEHCGKVVSVQINEFKDGRWQHNDFFPNKLRSLYGCTLRVTVRHTPPFINLVNGTHGEVLGIEGHLLSEIANYMNFTMKFQLMELDDRTMNFCCGVIAQLTKNQADLGMGYFRIRQLMGRYTTAIFPYTMSTLIATISLNTHNLTTYEVLLYPLDRPSWIYVTIAFASSFLFAECLYRAYRTQSNNFKWYKKRIFSFATLLAVFLGMPLVVDPQTQHNRVLYAAVLWMSFLLRSIYAALLYSLFRDNIHQQLPSNALELKQGGYSVVMNNFTIIDLTKLPNYGGYEHMRWIPIDSVDETIGFQYMEEHQHDQKRLVVISAKEFLIHYANAHRRAGMFHIVREFLQYQHLTMHVRKHSHLIRPLDMAVLHFNEIGLIELWKKRLLNENYLRSRHLYGQKFIQQNDLIAIYVIVGALQLLAAFILLLELLSTRNTKLRAFFNCNK